MRSERFYVNENSTDTSWDRTSDLPICSTCVCVCVYIYIYIYIFEEYLCQVCHYILCMYCTAVVVQVVDVWLQPQSWGFKSQ